MVNKKQIWLTLIVFLFLGIAKATGQEKNPQTVLIRAFELPKLNGGGSSRLVVTSPDGSVKSTDLKEVDIRTYTNADDNSLLIHNEIDRWKKEGVEIDAFSSQNTPGGAIITTIILSKD